MIFKEFDRARRESPLENILSVNSVKEIPKFSPSTAIRSPPVLGLELDVLPTNLYLQYGALFKDARIEDISLEIRLIRAVKSAF